jgi:hypothetical protein
MRASVCDDILQVAIHDSATVVALNARVILDEMVTEMNSRGPEGGWLGNAPDLPTLLANAPGPLVEVVKSRGVIRSAVTIMMGTVVVACIKSDEPGGMGPKDFLSSIPGVQVVFYVSQHKYSMTEGLAYVGPGLANEILEVDVRGLTMMHIAHIIEAAAESAFVHKRDFSRFRGEQLAQVLESACDNAAYADVGARRARRARAEDIIARTLDKNMERIKARLWRPCGRLAQTMIAKW